MQRPYLHEKLDRGDDAENFESPVEK